MVNEAKRKPSKCGFYETVGDTDGDYRIYNNNNKVNKTKKNSDAKYLNGKLSRWSLLRSQNRFKYLNGLWCGNNSRIWDTLVRRHTIGS